MKKYKIYFLISLFIVVAFTFAMSQEVHWADQKTGTWDIVLHYENGVDLIPPEYLPVSYRAWLADWDGTARISATERVVGETTELQFVYTIPDGIDDPGIQSIIYYAGFTATSTIEWGSEQPIPFLFGKAREPDAPHSFRVAP